jgi:hypothetical protein
MKQLLLLLIACLAAAAVLLVIVYYRAPKPSAIQITSQGPTIERLARLMHLVTTRIYISDVLTGEGEGCRGAWLIRGDALIGVDLRQAKITDKDFQTRQATICLPQPEVLQSRVDHERTRTWEVRKTTWVPWGGDPDSLRDNVMRQGQRLVAAAAGSPENLAHAKMVAEAILRGFYEEVGWQVRIVWRDPAARQSRQTRSTVATGVVPQRPRKKSK